jgi:exopolysaccharide production protein ExoY
MRIGTSTDPRTHHALVRGLDFGALLAAFAFTTILASRLARIGMFVWPAEASSDILGWPAQYAVLLLTALTAWSAVGLRLDIYHSIDESALGGTGRLGRAAIVWGAMIAVAIFLFKLPNVSRMFVLSFVLLSVMLILARHYIERTLRRLYQETQPRVAVVVGSGPQAQWLMGYLQKHFFPAPYAVVRRPAAEQGLGLDVDASQLYGKKGDFARSKSSFEVFIAAADMSEDVCSLIPQLVKRGVKTHIIPAVFDASIFRLALGDVGGIPLLTVRGAEMDALEAAVKRAIDLIGALLMLSLAAPLMLVLAVLVKLTSPGPVLFRQERLGKHGHQLYIYKFRTMRQDAEQMLKNNDRLYNEYVKHNYKLPQGRDPRITPLGRFLRQTSLDELPQLFNVIKGEMSLVGPRPVVPDEIGQYGDWASLLLSVQPGLTGQWQVSGRSDIADYAQRVKLDMEYLRDQSVATDLRILLRTVPAVLLRQGAH